MLDESKTQLLRLCHARMLVLSLSARNTIPCLGQVLTLFRAEASQIVYPV